MNEVLLYLHIKGKSKVNKTQKSQIQMLLENHSQRFFQINGRVKRFLKEADNNSLSIVNTSKGIHRAKLAL